MSTESNWANYEDYTKAASENVRKLAFAGIALVWILSGGGIEGVSIDLSYRWPLYLLIVSLALDFLHYTIGSVVWRIYSEYDERKGRNADGIDAPFWISLFTEPFFHGKIVVLAIALGWLLVTAYQQLLSTG